MKRYFLRYINGEAGITFEKHYSKSDIFFDKIEVGKTYKIKNPDMLSEIYGIRVLQRGHQPASDFIEVEVGNIIDEGSNSDNYRTDMVKIIKKRK